MLSKYKHNLFMYIVQSKSFDSELAFILFEGQGFKIIRQVLTHLMQFMRMLYLFCNIINMHTDSSTCYGCGTEMFFFFFISLLQCGVLLGPLLLLGSAWLTSISCNLLVKAAFTSRRRSYQYLGWC